MDSIPYLVVSQEVQDGRRKRRVYVALNLVDWRCIGIGYTRDHALDVMSLMSERLHGDSNIHGSDGDEPLLRWITPRSSESADSAVDSAQESDDDDWQQWLERIDTDGIAEGHEE